MSMNLTWLDDFLALAATGNFSRAAEERHMTQPAFSRRIRALEEWIGTDLFDRSSQPARLTVAGEWFRGTAEELLARVARVPGEARAVADAQSATLRFAATHALSFTFLPDWLRGLEERLEIGPVSLVSDVLERCEAMLQKGQVQFLLSHAPEPQPRPSASGLEALGFPWLDVGSDALIPVSAPDAQGHPRHALHEATAGAPLQILGYSPESGMGRILREIHGAALDRLPAQFVIRAHLASALRTMALNGRGLAWLPRSLITDDIASGRLVEAAAAEWQIEMRIRLYRGKAPVDPAGVAFWTAVRAVSRVS